VTFRSEIRDTVINSLLEKAREKNYGKYLGRLTLRHLRGFRDEQINFDFPVTALIGPNGGGKTTVLGAAGIIYRSIAPRTFFAKSGKYDAGMQDWSVEYEIVDRAVAPRSSIQRTASFKSLKWNRDAMTREVFVFGVSRTVPASERKELLRCTARKFAVPESLVSALTPDAATAIGRVLGKDVSNFRQLKIDRHLDVTLLTGTTKSNVEYSEFHFGAGESSVIRMISAIESATENALVLIEEIENGLHPVATIRLVEYLIEAADRKKIQVIFTTHSNEALLPLPDKAVWSMTSDKAFQGKLDVKSLRAITGQIQTESVIFVEDQFAKIWIEAILRTGDVLADHYEVHPMAGDGTAVAMNRYHNANPSIKTRSVCFIDGDSRQDESEDEYVFRLPGESPESYIFDKCMEKWSEIGGKLSVAMLQRFEDTDRVYEVCTDVRTTNHDAHLLFAQVGEKLGLVPEQTVAQAFCALWAQSNPAEVDGVRKRLPQKT
jgi:predicted ATPase